MITDGTNRLARVPVLSVHDKAWHEKRNCSLFRYFFRKQCVSLTPIDQAFSATCVLCIFLLQLLGFTPECKKTALFLRWPRDLREGQLCQQMVLSTDSPFLSRRVTFCKKKINDANSIDPCPSGRSLGTTLPVL